MIFVKCLFVVSAFTLSLGAHAGEKPLVKSASLYGTDLPFLKGVMIEIKSYDSGSRSYEAASPVFTGEGTFYITPEGLKKAVDGIDLNRVLKSPESIVGNQYKTDRELPTLKKSERAARRK